MSMIFDRFRTLLDAERFASAVTQRFHVRTSVYNTQEASDAADPFPFELTPPIVHVERSHLSHDNEAIHAEAVIEHFVVQFGGKFAGT